MPWRARTGTAASSLAVLLVAGSATVPAVSATASSRGDAGRTTRVSVSSAEAPANGDTFGGAMSGSGRYVGFSSDATNLVPGDTNNSRDVFLRDRRTGTTERISVSSAGRQGDEESFGSSLTPDGRYVAFTSRASNLVPGDTSGQTDAFVRDRRTRTTVRVSVSTKGVQGNSESNFPVISANGRYVAFQSTATNLVPGDTNADRADVFVRDLRSRTTERVSVSTTGAEADDYSFGTAISGGGRYVAFVSYATNLVPGDTNGDADVFVRDRGTGTTTRINVGPGGAPADRGATSVAMTPDGRYVAFTSAASNLVPGDTVIRQSVFLWDRRTGATNRVAFGNGPVLSPDGRYIAYQAQPAEVVPGAPDGHPEVFVRDRRTGTTSRISVAADGGPADDYSTAGGISADGRLVAFRSVASNLVPGDTNGVGEVFVRRVERRR